MHRNRHSWTTTILLLLVFGLLILVLPVSAQGTSTKIFITGSDATSAPTIELTVYAVDGLGNHVALDASSLTVKHNGTQVSDVTIGSPFHGGTFLLFLLDTSEGTDSYLPTIEEAIRQYANDPYMQDLFDYVAIYSMGDQGANQILGPTEFRNTVQNAFNETPLAATSGATALYDSLMGLLTGTIKPKSELVTHLVVMSDGTDIVSTRNTAEQVVQSASSLQIPVHTVLLENEEVKPENRQKGRDFMTQLANGSNGKSFTLATSSDLLSLWEHIAQFSNQTRVQYTITDLSGGDYTAEISLVADPSVKAQTTVKVPAGAPSIVLNVSEGGRQLTLTREGEPVTLRFSTSVSWLDGVDREITSAQLIVNNIPRPIDVSKLEQFEATIENFKFGENPVQIAIVDDQNNPATSQEVLFTVSEGTTVVVSEEVEPSGSTERIWDRIKTPVTYIGYCLGVLIVFLLFLGIMYLGRKSSLFRRLGLNRYLRRLPIIGDYYGEIYQVQQGAYQAKSLQRDAGRYSSDVKGAGKKVKKGRPNAYLEVIESVTQLPAGRINLENVEARLGRSSKQADIAFKSDGTVSRIHATIVLEGGLFRVFDEQSTSGTFVNEQAVPNYGLQLSDGDEIRLGAVRLRFRQLG